MLKQILNLNGAQMLNKNEQKSITGGFRGTLVSNENPCHIAPQCHDRQWWWDCKCQDTPPRNWPL